MRRPRAVVVLSLLLVASIVPLLLFSSHSDKISRIVRRPNSRPDPCLNSDGADASAEWSASRAAEVALEHWKDGISVSAFVAAWHAFPRTAGCFLVSVLSRRVYTRSVPLRVRPARDKSWEFRHKMVTDLVTEVVSRRPSFPDTEFIVCPDACSLDVNTTAVPVFSLSACAHSGLIPFPILEPADGHLLFWDGVVAQHLHARNQVAGHRTNRAFFEGPVGACYATPAGATALKRYLQGPRACGPVRLLHVAADSPYTDRIDVHIDHAGHWLSETALRLVHTGSTAEFERYRTAIHAEQSCQAGSNLRRLMLRGHLLLKQQTPCRQWYELLMQPNVHYVPVAYAFDNLTVAMRWTYQFPDTASTLMCNLRRYADAALSREAIIQYTDALLTRYQDLTLWNPQPRQDLIPADAGPLSASAAPSRPFSPLPITLSSARAVVMAPEPPPDELLLTMPVYISHNSRCTERRAGLTHALLDAGFPNTTWSIRWRSDVNREHLSQETLDQHLLHTPSRWNHIAKVNKQPQNGGSRLPVSQAADFIQHIEIWREIVRDRVPLALVLDDDVVPGEMFKHRLFHAMKQLPRDWGAVLGALKHDMPSQKLNLRPGVSVYELTPPRSAAMYVLKQDTAAKLLALIPPFTCPLDWELSYALLKQKIKSFVVFPPLVHPATECGLYKPCQPPDPPKTKTKSKKLAAMLPAPVSNATAPVCLLGDPRRLPEQRWHDAALHLMIDTFLGAIPQRCHSLIAFGNGDQNSEHPICSDKGWRRSPTKRPCLVYSAGHGAQAVLGDGATAMLKQAEQFGCRVQAWDAGLTTSQLSPRIALHGIGLEGFDDFRPELPQYGKLETLMQLGKDSDAPLDFVLLDCDGCEWGFFEQLFADSSLVMDRIGQLCVRFHLNTNKGFSLERWRHVGHVIRRHNLKSFYRKAGGSSISFGQVAGPVVVRGFQKAERAREMFPEYLVCYTRDLGWQRAALDSLMDLLYGQLQVQCVEQLLLDDTSGRWAMCATQQWRGEASTCLAMSAGISDDYRLERQLQSRTGCVVHMFDSEVSLPDRISPKLFFHRSGLSNREEPPRLHTLEALVKQMRVSDGRTISWMKWNCWGCEWLTAEQLWQENSFALESVSQLCMSLTLDAVTGHFSLERWAKMQTLLFTKHKFRVFWRDFVADKRGDAALDQLTTPQVAERLSPLQHSSFYARHLQWRVCMMKDR